MRILDSFYPDGTPEATLFGAYVMVAFLSVLVVRRYLPSDARLEHRGTFAVSMWINLSLLLAVGVPVLAVLYSDTSLFWIAFVTSVAAKALHALEIKYQEGASASSDRRIIPDGSGWRAESTHSVFERKPDAYTGPG